MALPRWLVPVATVAAVAAGVAFAGRDPQPRPALSPAPREAGPSASFPEGTAGARLAEYVKGDFEGERLERATWLKYQHWVMWKTEPAWDEAYVVKSYKVEKVDASATEAQGLVRYETLGVLDLQTFTYETSPSEQAVPFKLLLSEGEWKLGLPMLRPHPSPEAAIAFLARMKAHFTTLRPNLDQSIAAIRADAAKRRP